MNNSETSQHVSRLVNHWSAVFDRAWNGFLDYAGEAAEDRVLEKLEDELFELGLVFEHEQALFAQERAECIRDHYNASDWEKAILYKDVIKFLREEYPQKNGQAQERYWEAAEALKAQINFRRSAVQEELGQLLQNVRDNLCSFDGALDFDTLPESMTPFVDRFSERMNTILDELQEAALGREGDYLDKVREASDMFRTLVQELDP